MKDVKVYERALFETLTRSLTKGEDFWTADGCCLNHSSGVRLWMGNGRNYFKVYRPVEFEFSSKKIKKMLWKIALPLWKRVQDEGDSKERFEASTLIFNKLINSELDEELSD